MFTKDENRILSVEAPCRPLKKSTLYRNPPRPGYVSKKPVDPDRRLANVTGNKRISGIGGDSTCLRATHAFPV